MKIMKRIIQKPKTNQTQQCNYTNNYYGDQVCVIKQKSQS